MFQVIRSQSTGTIFKSFLNTDSALEIIVKLGIITSLFFGKFKDLIEISNAAVQLETKILYFLEIPLI